MNLTTSTVMNLISLIEPLEARIAPAFAAALSLGALDGKIGFKLSGVADGDRAGSSVSTAGDVNGDGFDDLIIGLPRADEGGAKRGAVYVVFGKPGAFPAILDPSLLDPASGFKLSGVADDDFAGYSASAAGDVNGDGFDDVIIGALDANEGGDSRGAGYVVFGKAGGFGASVALAGLDGHNGFKLSGVADGDLTGFSTSAAGDVNGDGFDDVIIGALYADDAGTDNGTSYVVFGRSGGFGASVALAGLDGSGGFKLSSAASGANAAARLSMAGDVNGDGFADVFIGAFQASEGGTDRGAGYVVFGKAGRFGASVDLEGLDGRNGFKLAGIADHDGAGKSVSSAGDVNGDGFGDLLIGAYGAAEGGIERGAAYVVFGQPDVKVTLTGGGKTATFPDTDGDLVTVKVTKGALAQRDFTFSGGILQKLNLADDGDEFAGTSLTVTVKKAGLGDGKFNLGAIDAHGLDLGTVTLPGDLGQIDAGDTKFKTPAILALTVGSLGVIAGTQPVGTINPLQSDLVGTLGKLTVKGDVRGAVNVTGGTGANIGLVSIGGFLDGSAGGVFAGLIRAGGNIGAVTVKGRVIGGADFSGIIAGGKLGLVTLGADLISNDPAKPVTISALGKLGATTAADAIAIAGLNVKTNLVNARILAGYTASLGAANADASIGAVTVGGNWTTSSLVAGVADSTGDGFGRNDTLIGGGNPNLIATIASITVKLGFTADPGPAHYGITAQRIVKAKFLLPVTLSPLAGDAIPLGAFLYLVDFP